MDKETTYCNQLFVCQEYNVFVGLLRRNEQDGNHKCGEIYCETCFALLNELIIYVI